MQVDLGEFCLAARVGYHRQDLKREKSTSTTPSCMLVAHHLVWQREEYSKADSSREMWTWWQLQKLGAQALDVTCGLRATSASFATPRLLTFADNSYG